MTKAEGRNLCSTKNADDHKAAVEEIARLVIADPEPGSSEADALEALVVLVENYEKETFPIR